MSGGGPVHGSHLHGEIRLVIVESPDLAAPLVGALDVADIGAWMWVEAEGALYFSPRVLHLLDLPLEPQQDLLARFIRGVHPEERALVRRLVNRDVPAGPFTLRYRYTPPDGPLRWIEDRGRVERDAAGTLIRQGGAMREVTREMGQEQERAEANARLEALVNAMPFAVWGYSGHTEAELRVTHQNALSMAWRGNLLGRSLADMPPALRPVWRTEMADALRGNIVRVRTGDEIEGHVLDKIVAPVAVHGTITGVVGISIDVTEEERLRTFEALLTDISTDFASRSAATLGPALTAALERIGRFFGAPSASVSEISDDSHVSVKHLWREGQPPADNPPEIEYDGRDIRRFLDRYANNEAVVVRSLDDLPVDGPERRWLIASGVHSFAAVPARHSDGVLMVLAVSASPGETIAWPADTTSLLRLAGTLLSGIVARLRAEAAQRVVERRMQDAQKLESLGVLAGGIAHDFNNLLTAILGNASLLRSEHANTPSIDGPLEQIEIASKRAAELCRQMLAFAGRGRFALQLLNLNVLLRESESLMRLTIPKKTTLQLALQDPLPAVLADSVQIRQLLLNLLTNAGEAIGDREGTITIGTATTQCTTQELARSVFNPQLPEGEYVRLRVTDTGDGIAPEIAARIFEPFFTTKFTGRGLGLSAVVGIVRAHGGALRLHSRPGQGTTFELLLPAQSGAAVAAPTFEFDGVVAATSRWHSKGTVLVVDDEFGVRDLVRTVLERAGLTVILRSDGRSAIDVFRQEAATIRLVLIDLTMPGIDGRETLAGIRAIKPDARAILMSGYTQADIAKASSDAFLQKPFTPASLRAVVRKVLGED